MEFDGSFEDFQETKQFASVRKTNLRTKVLKKKKATGATKSESAPRKTVKKTSASQNLFSAESGTPALKTSKLTSSTQQKLLDIACIFAKPPASASNAAGSKCDNYNSTPCSQLPNKPSNALDVTNDFLNLNHQHVVPTTDSSTKANDDKPNQANVETVNKDIHIIQKQSCDYSLIQSDNVSSSPLSRSANNEPPSQTSDTIWQCPMCKESIASSWRNSHFIHCLKKFEHKQGFTGQQSITEPFSCDICKLDITSFNTLARSEHVNRCLDAHIANIKPKDTPCNGVAAADSTLLIAECPLCNKACSSTQAKLAHVKKCSQALGIDVQSVIVALQLQKKHAVERISLGLPLVPTKSTLPKTKPSTLRKLVREPKSEADADVQLAKALSLSIDEEEKRKDLLELSRSNDMELLTSSMNQFQEVKLQAPRNAQKPGGRKRKPITKAVPILLLRTEEDRLKLLQQKVSALIIAPESMGEAACSEAKEPSNREVGDSCSIIHEKSSILWDLSGKSEEKISYYTSELLEFVEPSNIEPGSKLKSLSQVPGHHVCTQQPYNFTFDSNMSQHQENCDATLSTKLPLKIPSTQEMLDIIVEENTSADRVFLQSQIQPNISKSAEEEANNDGFLRTENKPRSFLNHNPVISCLETLVNNTWMSDISITVSDGSLVPAHKLLLILRCPGLREDLMHDEVIHWSDVTSEECTNFLNFVYTGSTTWPSALNSKILLLAKRCKMKEFEDLKKTFDPNQSFNENEASQIATLISEANIQETNANQPFLEHTVNSSEKEDCSDKNNINLIVSDSLFPRTNPGDSIFPSFPEINSVFPKFSISNNNPDINFEESDNFANSQHSPQNQTEAQGITMSKYFDNVKDQDEIECLDIPHTIETKLSAEIEKTHERINSPDLFVCDSDDDIPANQEVNIERSCTSESTNESSFLIPQSSYPLAKESMFCNDNTKIDFSPSTAHTSSLFPRERLFYSSDSKLADTNVTTKLCSSTDISDCQHDKEVICIEENDVSCESNPHAEHSTDYVNNLDPLPIPDRSIFKIHPIDSSLWWKTTVIQSASSSDDSSVASEPQSEDDAQFCEEVCQISPSKEHTSQVVNESNESPSDNNSALLDTPVSSQKANRRKLSMLFESTNGKSPVALGSWHSPNMNRSYEELFNASCFNSTTKFKRNYSDSALKSKSSVLCDESNSLNEDNLQTKGLSFHNSSLEQIIAHEKFWSNANPIGTGMNNASCHLDSPTINRLTFVANCKSPIVLSSDDELAENLQNHKSHSLSEVVSSISDDELVQYNNCPVSNSKHTTMASPYKRKSFISMSQPVKKTYDEDSDDDDVEILPLHMRIQLFQKKKEEEKSCPSVMPPSVNVSDESNELPDIKISASVNKVHHAIATSNSKNNDNVRSRATTPDLGKQAKSLKRMECVLSDSPVTPLPNYQTMVTPEIKMALKKYGIRALPRKKAVSLLSHIYNETHPIVNSLGDIITEPKTPCPPKISSSQPCKKQATRKRKIANQVPQEQTVAVDSMCIRPLSKKIKTSKKTSKSVTSEIVPNANQDVASTNGQNSDENMEDLCCSQNSSKSDISDMPEESLLELDEVFGSQKYENDILVKKKIHDYITLNTELYAKILMYEPLNLGLFQQELKDNGLKISATNLMNFFDEECITFTLPRSEKSKKKQQQRTQKFRKRMIAKQSQQCSQTCT